jgi:hypothetical protein
VRRRDGPTRARVMPPSRRSGRRWHSLFHGVLVGCGAPWQKCRMVADNGSKRSASLTRQRSELLAEGTDTSDHDIRSKAAAGLSNSSPAPLRRAVATALRGGCARTVTPAPARISKARFQLGEPGSFASMSGRRYVWCRWPWRRQLQLRSRVGAALKGSNTLTYWSAPTFANLRRLAACRSNSTTL